METSHQNAFQVWLRLPLPARAVISGLLMTVVGANVWPILVLNVPTPLAAIVEAVFLGSYLWWASGEWPPQTSRSARAIAFRRGRLTRVQWRWSIVAALLFAVSVHASIYLLFRVVAFPRALFRQGYDLSFISGLPLRWLAVVVSAASAAICEETGIRGYLQRPFELRWGTPTAILISSAVFAVLHLSKSWALAGMVPIVFGAGVLLGLIAWSSRSLIPGMIGHFAMDVGLFAYWWTGIAGDFSERPIAETGLNLRFLVACGILAIALSIVVYATARLRQLSSPSRSLA